MSMRGSVTELNQLDEVLEKESLRGLWVREEEYWVQPKPFGGPKLWKWAKIREGLDAAIRLVPTNYKGVRRAITLTHPNLSRGTSHLLSMAVQLVKPGEAVYAHRHTAAAIRFVLQGGEGVYTITDGEKCIMEKGDLVVQPNWGWHNHINETDRDAIWVDCLDSGLMSLLHTYFQEPHPSEQVKLFKSPVDSSVLNPGTLAPPGRDLKKLTYKWRDTLALLRELLPEDKSAYDGRCLEYRNPATGGPMLPSFACWIQMLEQAEETSQHRHTSVHIYYAFEGSGVTEVDGELLAWEQGDFFVVPNWSWHRHKNSDREPAILFSTTDRPLLELLGLYREERR